MRNPLKRLLASVAAMALFAIPLAAQDAMEQNPYTKANHTWIILDGTVQDVTADAFTLDYGDGLVTVEFDDGDRDADAYKLVTGDKVRVSGVVDDDLWETTSIEAASVYVENLDTYFYASSVDEEDVYLVYDSPVIAASTVLDGMVTEVNDDTFEIHTGTRTIEVHVGNMPYNPIDAVGYQRIDVGDRVSVRGEMDSEFWDVDPEIEAVSVTTLFDG